MVYEIVNIDEKGNGYVVVTLPNGDSFGQLFRVSDATDETKFFAEVEEQLHEAEARLKPETPKIIDSRILAQVRQPRQLPSRLRGVISRG